MDNHSDIKVGAAILTNAVMCLMLVYQPGIMSNAHKLIEHSTLIVSEVTVFVAFLPYQ